MILEAIEKLIKDPSCTDTQVEEVLGPMVDEFFPKEVKMIRELLKSRRPEISDAVMRLE